MSIVRGLLAGLSGVLLMLAVSGCGSAPVNAAPAADRQTPSSVAVTPSQPTGEVIWGRVPYCNCLATSATANVANALQQANLTVSLQELSPSEGWLYFAVTFDPQTTTAEQVGNAMVAGGAEVRQSPP